MPRIPAPTSGGLILSYRCNAECLHCMYACSRHWENDWMTDDDLERILSQLAPLIEPSPYGPKAISLAHGLHFTGGEPMLRFDRLVRAVESAAEKGIPSTFLETNAFWCHDDETTRNKLQILRDKGLCGILVSVNPFYREFVPFTNTRRCLEYAYDIFGENAVVYQLDYFRRFLQWEEQDRLSIKEQIDREGSDRLLRHVEFFLTGRAPYALQGRLRPTLGASFPLYSPEELFAQPCLPRFVRSWHNHFDLYGNYMPGYCGGVTYGDCRQLEELVDREVDAEAFPVLALLMNEDRQGLYAFARERGFVPKEEGYYSACHLCMEMRKYLVGRGDFAELEPRAFYENLRVGT